MAYERKTIDTWELQLNYGYGWEYTLTEFTREEARARLKEYRENQPQYPARLVKKRVRINTKRNIKKWINNKRTSKFKYNKYCIIK